MLKKETANRYDKLFFKTTIKPFFQQSGFKFKDREGLRMIGDFQIRFTCYLGDYHRGIYYNPTTNQAEIQFRAYLNIRHPAFMAWVQTTGVPAHGGAAHSSCNLNFVMPVPLAELGPFDFFTPINGDPLNGLHHQDLGYPQFSDLVQPGHQPQNWHDMLKGLEALADLETLYAQDAARPDKYLALTYLNRLDEARAAAAELWPIYNEQYQNESRLDYRQSWFNVLQLVQQSVKKLLDLDLALPQYLSWASIHTGKTGHWPAIGKSWQELYTLKDLPSAVYRTFLNANGELMTTHTGNNKGTVIIWSVDGQVRTRVGFEGIPASDFLGYIPEKQAYFMGNLLIFSDGSHHYLPVDQHPDAVQTFAYASICADVVFDTAISAYIVCTHTDRRTSAVTFFDEQFNRIKSFECQGKVRQVYPDKQWIVMLDDKNDTCSVLEYAGNTLHTFQTRNAMNHHRFVGGYRWLVVYGYYAQSEVYDLSTRTLTKIYAHPTYLDGYKDQYVQVEHNFGLNQLAESPDGRYVVGAACHGRWVVWTLPDWKRIELVPDAAYLATCIEPYFFELNGERFLANNGAARYPEGLISRSAFGNSPSAICFTDQGARLVLVVKDQWLVFNDRFEHIETHVSSEGLMLNGDYFTIREDGGILVGT